MGKAKKLLLCTKAYQDFLDCIKQMDMPVAVTKAKENHPTSLYTETPISGKKPLGEDVFSCEVRNKNTSNYSLQITTDAYRSRVVCRLDEGNGTHRNNYPDIPLVEQRVPTPHIHTYDDKGRFLAAPIEHDSKLGPMHINDAFNLFCNRFSILPKSGLEKDYTIIVAESGNFSLPQDPDPLNGVTF